MEHHHWGKQNFHLLVSALKPFSEFSWTHSLFSGEFKWTNSGERDNCALGVLAPGVKEIGGFAIMAEEI